MIAIGLNLILGVLLVCALILGLRLERKLRGLKDSHADFAKAVGELDQAAGRTEHSLAALRAGTETAKTEVASRIDQARVACQRLEKLVADADKAADRLAQPLMLHDRAPPPARPVPAPTPAPAPSAIARPEPEYMWADDMMAAQPAPTPAPSPSRSRAKLVDDDLFAHGPPPAPRRPAARQAAADPFVAAPAPLEIDEIGRSRRAPEPVAAARPAPAFAQQALGVPLKADNDPVIGASRNDLASDRAAREAFFREVLEREAAPDPFEQGRFAHERRAMLAAVMGGRR